MLVLSSPSGAGKSTISREILARDAGITMSVSLTTRPIRPGETDGDDYVFVAPEAFEEMAAAGAFLEHAVVFDHRYGTPRAPVEDGLAAGRDVLFDVDWQGTQQLAEAAREDLVSVFILPPSIQELERRLRTRAQDSAAVVESRMAKATSEMSHWREYDYIIVNEDVETSVVQVQAILAAERLKRDRRVGLGDFVRGMGVGQ
ncbi:MAG: guanylate kinase [Rhodospirillales bacterium]